MSEVKVDFTKVREVLSRYEDNLDAMRQACRQERTLEGLKQRLADLADKQVDHIGAALAAVDASNPRLRLRHIKQELREAAQHKFQLEGLQKAMLLIAPKMKAEAVAAIKAAKEQQQLLAAPQQQLTAARAELDLDTEVRTAAARVTSIAISRVVLQAAMEEAARKKAVALNAAAAAAADMAARVTSWAQEILAKTADLDAEHEYLQMLDRRREAALAGVQHGIDQLKVSKQSHLPISAAAQIAKAGPVSGTPRAEVADLGSDDSHGYHQLQTEQQEVMRQLKYRMAQLKMVQAELVSLAAAAP